MQVKIPFLKPDVIDSLKASVSSAEATLSAVSIPYQSTFEKATDLLFWWCIDVLKYMETVTGYSYEIINLAIFVFLQPALVLTFFTLWIYEKNKKRGVNYG